MGESMRIVYLSKPSMLRAFNEAKDFVKSKNDIGEDYVQKPEFRIFLMYLRQYFEYFVMFRKIDTSDDNRVSINEFKLAIPTMKKWGVEIKNPEEEFKLIDKNGGGQVLFEEFAYYCIQKNLDLENDGDDTDFA